jgi:predicted TIM-barrel fold metal-dependent hydrolase
MELHPPGTLTFDPGTMRTIEMPGIDGDPISYWHFEDSWLSLRGSIHAAGDPSLVNFSGLLFDQLRPGCWDPKHRLLDMDINHTQASLCFPNYPRFCGQLFSEAADKTLGLLCIRAYNDWMVEEWCAESDGRLIPLCIVPLWDAEAAAAEIRRNADRGVRAVAFSEIPAWLGLPSIHSGYWEPFFAACEETSTVIFLHIGSGTKTVTTSADAPLAVSVTGIFANSSASLLDFLFSGVLIHHPGLKLVYAESQSGWIPYVLQRADDFFHQQHHLFVGKMDVEPSSLYEGRIYSSFYRDEVAMANLDAIGAKQVMFEVDYPHADTTFPHSAESAAKQFGHLDADIVHQLARGNAIELLGLHHLAEIAAQ